MSYLVIAFLYFLPFVLLSPKNRERLFGIYVFAFITAAVSAVSMFLGYFFGPADYGQSLEKAFSLPISFWLVDVIKDSSSAFVVISLSLSLFFTLPIDVFLAAMLVNFKAPNIAMYIIQIVLYTLILMSIYGDKRT